MTILFFHYPAPSSAAALESAIDEATLRQSTLVIAGVTSSDSHADNHASTAEELAELAASARERGVSVQTRLLSSTEAAEAVVELSESLPAELLVIGLRKRSPVGKLFLGSIAQELLLDATCPVLAVKAPAGAQ